MNLKQRQEARQNYSEKGTVENDVIRLSFKYQLLATTIAYISLSWQTIVATAGIGLLYSKLESIWVHIPTLFESQTSRFVSSLAIIIIGALAYWLREKRRFTYASLELSVAAITAYNAAIKLHKDNDPFTGILAFLACIYIVVRACDNFDKASIERKIKNAKKNGQEISDIH
jgi:hypothetical protein